MAWTLERRRQWNDVFSGAFVFTIRKSTFWPQKSWFTYFVLRPKKKDKKCHDPMKCFKSAIVFVPLV